MWLLLDVIKMPLKHYLSSQSGWRLAERSGNYLFGTSTIDFMSRDVFCLTRSAQRLPAKLSLATSSPARRNARSVEIRRLPTGVQGVLNQRWVSKLVLIWPVSKCQAQLLAPISFSLSQQVRSLRRAGQKIRQTLGFSHFLLIFTPSKKWLEICLEKWGQKCENHGFWGSKTFPK